MSTDVPACTWEGASADLTARLTAVDWAATALGDPGAWSPALQGAVRTVLDTRFPAVLLWGPAFTLVYNDSYVEMIGEKHPSALGQPAAEVFVEAWDHIGPLLEGVRTGQGACYFQDDLVPLVRRGFLEECYFTFSYSPVRNAEGEIEGVLDIAADTTATVIGQRRAEALTRLSDVLANVETRQDLRRLSLYLLRDLVRDLPAVDIRIPGLPEDVPIAHSGAPEPELPSAAPAAAEGASFFVEGTEQGQVVWQPLSSFPRPGLPMPTLVCRTSEQLAFDADYRGFLRLVAASLTQALTRIDLLEAERDAATAQRDMSVALQRALLTAPMQPDHLRVAVRYAPATDIAQIGGDWHDAFMQPDGALLLAIGDVAGHDLDAAAAMAQIRNLARGIAVATDDGPARILEHLDHALELLHVDAMATAIFARIEQTPEQKAAGLRTLRWSRAGHPPPVLLHPDGTAELLEEGGETILGVFADVARTDCTIELGPETTVVLYTDGLIERRGVPLDASLEYLRSEVSGLQDLDPEQLCDHLLAHFASPGQDDDIALMVLRARAE
ncbi:SpoIIE family protein phosphatase [Nocardioides zeae]|uniref:SpoIIE family protein phosphatase n=1 Tax=Nocardioides imazamoxiresistens TaxID=3231893 RepID=A0ABU3Q1P4_9ACTN|nr:SpoIIE family protein phosphatase [Nocardioides zeae]MDT9594960.1 SpoIIE family protein phosphatase [Nocardioides zeae]